MLLPAGALEDRIPPFPPNAPPLFAKCTPLFAKCTPLFAKRPPPLTPSKYAYILVPIQVSNNFCGKRFAYQHYYVEWNVSIYLIMS